MLSYPFDYGYRVLGTEVAPFMGRARIEASPMPGEDWCITGIALVSTRGDRVVVLPMGDALYARIALWLLTDKRADIQAEWAQQVAGHQVKEVA